MISTIFALRDEALRESAPGLGPNPTAITLLRLTIFQVVVSGALCLAIWPLQPVVASALALIIFVGSCAVAGANNFLSLTVDLGYAVWKSIYYVKAWIAAIICTLFFAPIPGYPSYGPSITAPSPLWKHLPAFFLGWIRPLAGAAIAICIGWTLTKGLPVAEASPLHDTWFAALASAAILMLVTLPVIRWIVVVCLFITLYAYAQMGVIGVSIAVQRNDNEPLKTAQVIPRSPADKAGIKPGWFLISVDGTNVTNVSAANAVSMIRGPAGAIVTLELADPTRSKTNKFAVERCRRHALFIPEMFQ